jgi:hypothetical protein
MQDYKRNIFISIHVVSANLCLLSSVNMFMLHVKTIDIDQDSVK